MARGRALDRGVRLLVLRQRHVPLTRLSTRLPIRGFFLLLVVFHSVLPTLRWQPVVATIVGLPAVMSVGICLLHHRWRAVLYVPEYLAFRIVRSYFTLAAVLSLIYPPVAVRRRL